MLKQFAIVAISLAITVPAVGQQNSASRDVQSSAKALPETPQPQKHPADSISNFGRVGSRVVPGSSQDPMSLEGLRVKLSLLNQVSSKLPSGSSFQARLGQPVMRSGQALLPEGTVFEGHVETRHAGHIMRPGSVFMTFDRVLLPGGSVQPISLSLLSADNDAVKSDSEGMLHPALSKKRLAIQLGGTALTAKVADDLAQVAGGTAVNAGTARYIGLAAAATFFLVQKGREVNLRPGDMIEVEFERIGPMLPISLSRVDQEAVTLTCLPADGFSFFNRRFTKFSSLINIILRPDSAYE
jgi:hypothetical protein